MDAPVTRPPARPSPSPPQAAKQAKADADAKKAEAAKAVEAKKVEASAKAAEAKSAADAKKQADADAAAQKKKDAAAAASAPVRKSNFRRPIENDGLRDNSRDTLTHWLISTQVCQEGRGSQGLLRAEGRRRAEGVTCVEIEIQEVSRMLDGVEVPRHRRMERAYTE